MPRAPRCLDTALYARSRIPRSDKKPLSEPPRIENFATPMPTA